MKRWQEENNRLQDNISYLNRRLDVEEEWKPYTDTRNVAQKDYEELRDNSFYGKINPMKKARRVYQPVFWSSEKEQDPHTA